MTKNLHGQGLDPSEDLGEACPCQTLKHWHTRMTEIWLHES